MKFGFLRMPNFFLVCDNWIDAIPRAKIFSTFLITDGLLDAFGALNVVFEVLDEFGWCKLFLLVAQLLDIALFSFPFRGTSRNWRDERINWDKLQLSEFCVIFCKRLFQLQDLQGVAARRENFFDCALFGSKCSKPWLWSATAFRLSNTAVLLSKTLTIDALFDAFSA